MAKQRKGFAVMPPERVRAIASMGGVAAHKSGKAHKWDSAGASAAGRKGGRTTQARRKSRQEGGVA